MYYRGTVLKRIKINEDECVESLARKDGVFQFIHRKPCGTESGVAPAHFESAPYLTAEAAEAAARRKFKL